jgi:predicted ArsR family transcriptional regulator
LDQLRDWSSDVCSSDLIFHCPVKDLVAATDLPCRTELGLVRELLGGTLTRLEHAAHKQGTCSYGVPRGRGTPPSPTAA